MIDFERGAKATGSKFYFLTGDDAVRELAMINHMVQYHQANGYTLVIPPYLVNRQTAEFAGILPRFEGDYYSTDDGKILIPTAETPLVGMHADEIFREEDLPVKYVALSPCFRKEGGSPGKRDRGLRRVHQFHKVELFVICTPDQSEELHVQMIQQVLKLLHGLPAVLGYKEFSGIRNVELEPHDRAPWSNRTVDLELFANSPEGGDWLEVSSISNTGENQSKLAQIRYKPKAGGKNVKCHLLNGSGVATPRVHVALEAAGIMN